MIIFKSQFYAAFTVAVLTTVLPSRAEETKKSIATPVVSDKCVLMGAEEKYQRARQLAKGDGVSVDRAEAYRLLMEASGEGDAEATGAIGLFHQNGWAGLEQDNVAAVEWYRKGYEMGGVRSGYNYGLMLVNGLGVQVNLNEGIALIESAANRGIPEAQLVLGSYYYFGKFGKPVDYDKAFSLMKPAAESGNPHAENMMGILHEHGYGTKTDKEAAIEWYRKAAKQNLKKAQASLAMLLDANSKDPERRAESLKWFYVAVKNNEITAIKALRSIRLNASSEEVATAQKEADEFRHQMLRNGIVPE